LVASATATAKAGTTEAKTAKIDKGRSLPDDASAGCWRECPPGARHKNKIVLYPWNYAGLSDRGYIIKAWSNIAGYLCATVYVPPPRYLLSAAHNGGQKVPRALHWDDMNRWRFRSDHSPAVVQYEHDDDGGFYFSGEDKNMSFLDSPLFSGPQYSDWKRIRLNKQKHKDSLETRVQTQLSFLRAFTDIIDDQQQNRSATPHGNTSTTTTTTTTTTEATLATPTTTVLESTPGFIWEINVDWFKIGKFVLDFFEKQYQATPAEAWSTRDRQYRIPAFADNHNRYNRDNKKHDYCNYVEQESSTASLVTERVYDHLLAKAQPHADYHLGLLHIRRGDSVQSCDTSLSEMVSFLTCSLNNTEAYGNILVMLRSDEQDPCYREAIRDIIEGLGHTFGDLDATVKEVVQDYPTNSRLLNNMFIYRVEAGMEWHKNTRFRLTKRREMNCWPCNKLYKNWQFDGIPEITEPYLNATVSLKEVNKTYHACLAKKSLGPKAL